jgi:hypothetical protein
LAGADGGQIDPLGELLGAVTVDQTLLKLGLDLVETKHLTIAANESPTADDVRYWHKADVPLTHQCLPTSIDEYQVPSSASVEPHIADKYLNLLAFIGDTP